MEDSLSLRELISSLNLRPEQIAIELNQTVVRRMHWPETMLRDDDRVEIVHFVGGGCEPEAVVKQTVSLLTARYLPA